LLKEASHYLICAHTKGGDFMDSKLTSLEVIGMAIRSEEDAAKFYGHISKMIENDLVRAKYEHLAREEVNHRRMLTELYKKMSGGQDRPPRIPGTPETAEGGGVPEDMADSIGSLLKLAVQRERATDLSGQRILRYLADVEHGHELMLEKELDAYLRDKDWYVGKEPELIHVGP
jgi:hypothetical protein